MRLPFQAFRIAFVTITAAIIITICAITTYAASSPSPPAPATTAANQGFAADSRTLFAPVIYLAPPGPARATNSMSYLAARRSVGSAAKTTPAASTSGTGSGQANAIW